MGLGGLLGGKQKGPSAAELQQQQEASARAERDRLAQEKAGKEAANMKIKAAQESKRDAFRVMAEDEPDTAGRKRYLQSV